MHFSGEKADTVIRSSRVSLNPPQMIGHLFTPSYCGSIIISYSKSPLMTEVNELSSFQFQFQVLAP